MDALEVIGECDCGCGTIDLQVGGRASEPKAADYVTVEAYGKGVDVLLFARDGLLSSLEIIDHGDSRPLPYPEPSELTIWVPPRGRKSGLGAAE